MELEFKENQNGNWVAKTPTLNTVTVFRQKDDYGVPWDSWTWVASRDDGVKKWSEGDFATAEKAIDDAKANIKLASPLAPEMSTEEIREIRQEFESVYDTWNEDMRDLMGGALSDSERRAFG